MNQCILCRYTFVEGGGRRGGGTPNSVTALQVKRGSNQIGIFAIENNDKK